MKDALKTPFGTIIVTLNQESIPFKFTHKIFSYQNGSCNEQLRLHLIDIDTTDMKVGDTIHCGFEKQELQYYSGEERSDILMVENEEIVLAICGYNPQYHEAERELHSYYMEAYEGSGFTYKIERNPEQYQIKEYHTRIITLAVCWTSKNKLDKNQEIIEEALTKEIKYKWSLLKGTFADAQDIINKYAGKGIIVANNKEKIECDTTIGTYVSIENGEIFDTNSAIIHYSKQGAKLVPTNPKNICIQENMRKPFNDFISQNLDKKLKITTQDDMELIVTLDSEYDLENDLKWGDNGYDIYHVYLFKVLKVLKGDKNKVGAFYEINCNQFPKKIEIVNAYKKLARKSFLKSFLLLTLIALIIYFIIYSLLSGRGMQLKEVRQKSLYGVIGIIIIAYAFYHLLHSNQKQENQGLLKKSETFLYITIYMIQISIMSAFIFVILGLLLYSILCFTGSKEETGVGVGTFILALSLLYGFFSARKKNKSKNRPVIVQEEKLESKKILGMENEFSWLYEAFPRYLKEDFLELSFCIVIQRVTQVNSLFSNSKIIYHVNNEEVKIPYRIYFEEIEENEFSKLTEIQRQMLYCIYTRSYNGYVREKYLKKLLESDLQEWQIPFIVKLSDEYVVEILDVIYDVLKNRDNSDIQIFCQNNKKEFCRGYSKMVSYWNEFYRSREHRFHKYIGRKLYWDCFGYSRRLENKKYLCECCGYNTLKETYIGNYQICPVCHWKQGENHVNYEINKIALKEAKKNYKKIGAVEEKYLDYVRKPLDSEKEPINVEQILKRLKLMLLERGFTRRKGEIPFYEYHQKYFRIIYQKETFSLVIERSRTLEEARNEKWEPINCFSLTAKKEILTKKIVNYLLNQGKNKK